MEVECNVSHYYPLQLCGFPCASCTNTVRPFVESKCGSTKWPKNISPFNHNNFLVSHRTTSLYDCFSPLFCFVISNFPLERVPVLFMPEDVLYIFQTINAIFLTPVSSILPFSLCSFLNRVDDISQSDYSPSEQVRIINLRSCPN